jgi:hypothetical protein
MTETTHPELVSLDGFAMPVLVSPGDEERGRTIAALADRSYSWLCETTGRRPRFTLYMVGRDHWDAVADVPVYGMPQAVPEKVVTSPDAGDWWPEYWDAIRPQLSSSTIAELATVFGDPPDFTTLADLVVTHELTHLFHEIDPETWASEFPEDWVMELFANIGMWGYVAEREPEQLALLSTMVDAAREVDPATWPMSDLSQMGQSMQVSIPAYVWYEFRLIELADSIWNSGGTDAMLTFQRTLGDPSLDPDTVVERLTRIDGPAAVGVREWPDVAPR